MQTICLDHVRFDSSKAKTIVIIDGERKKRRRQERFKVDRCSDENKCGWPAKMRLELTIRPASPRSPLFSSRSVVVSSPAFRSLPRWSHCFHSRISPFRLNSQIRSFSLGSE
ncbi:hypothetical protein N665_0198s0213 [Sinapis alba]|nr:hypothetical protein N665_0198s0213 [Sinapis alba]